MSTQQYREVKRKAAVGERIKIVNSDPRDSRHKNGDVGTVNQSGDAGIFVTFDGSNYGSHGVYAREYVTLEPLESAAPSPLSSDPLYAAFRQFVADNAAEIRAILPEVEGLYSPKEPQLSAKPPIRVAPIKPLTRAEVIAKARADVAELIRIGHDSHSDITNESPFHNRCYTATFHVNREKRTVTALVNFGVTLERVPDAKFIAKCSPADVFHADLGKAIALRKALGLAVPTEYTDAPQPEKAEVGTVVLFEGYRVTARPDTDWNVNYTRGTACVSSVVISAGKILDDTDVDYSTVTTKGVAA
ncbi:hypothetical protein [Paenibacillus sp. FSL K6-2859]|uniref:hypothetical protein n=1 Tax=Paenibacillus sp. FSL K6-2859 TaxID=2921482 RepID=UPI0030FC79CF